MEREAQGIGEGKETKDIKNYSVIISLPGPWPMKKKCEVDSKRCNINKQTNKIYLPKREILP